jgi:WD40 repeat protein
MGYMRNSLAVWSRILILPVMTTAVLFHATACGDEPISRSVRAVAFSPDGRLLAAGAGEPHEPGTVTLWGVATLKPVWTHRETEGVPAVAFAASGDKLAVAVYNHTAKVLDTATGKVTATLPHPKEVRGVAFSPDGQRLATTCWDRIVRVWDVAAGTEKVACKGHTDRIFTVAFSPDGKLLLSAGGSDGAKLWDATTGAEKRTWKHGNFYVPCAAFSPDGRWALTGGYEGTVRIWNVATGELRARFSGTGGVHTFAFSPVAHVLAVGGYGRQLSLFGLTFQEPKASDQKRISSLLARLDDDSYDLREATSKQLLEIGFIAEPELRQTMKESKSAEVRIRARRVRQEILSKSRASLRGHTDQVEAAAFSTDGQILASGGKDGTVRLWQVSSGKETAHLTSPR